MSKDKNVENKNEGVGSGTRLRVRAREVSPSIYFHFQHFYLSTYVPLFLFSTFLLSTKLGRIPSLYQSDQDESISLLKSDYLF